MKKSSLILGFAASLTMLGVTACTDYAADYEDTYTKQFAEDGSEPSSDDKEYPEFKSSDSKVEEKSSESKTEESSSSGIAIPEVINDFFDALGVYKTAEIEKANSTTCGDLWCAPLLQYGFGFYTDESEGGTSFLVFSKGESPKDVIQQEHALNVHYELGAKTTKDTYGYTGHNYGLGKDPVDIADWGGLCIVYAFEVTGGEGVLNLEIQTKDEETLTEWDSYSVLLPATIFKTSYFVADVPWKDFKQGGWGKAVDKNKVLENAAAIQVMARGVGSSSDLSLVSIGKLGSCTKSVTPIEYKCDTASVEVSNGIRHYKCTDGKDGYTTPSVTRVPEINATKYTCGDLWCAPLRERSFNSGYGNQWVYGWHEVHEKPGSSIIWSNGDVYNEVAISPFATIEKYGAMSGTVKLEDSENPFAGLGFDVVDGSKGADVSDWDGLCLVYAAEGDVRLRLRVRTPNEEELTGWNQYEYELETTGSASTYKVIDVPWEKFTQESSWGNFVLLDEVIKNLSAINIEFGGGEKNASKTLDFSVISVGRFGSCYEHKDLKERAKKIEMCGDLWCGPMHQTHADLSKFTEGDGFLFDYEAGSEGQKEYADNLIKEDPFSALIEAKDGIVGKFTMGPLHVNEDESTMKSLIGIGVHLGGEDSEGEKMGTGVDITAMNGTCIVYSLKLTGDIYASWEIITSNEEFMMGYNTYKVLLPEHDDIAIENFKWEDYSQEEGWGKHPKLEDVLKDVVRHNLKFQGAPNSTAEFNIISIGSEGSCGKTYIP